MPFLSKILPGWLFALFFMLGFQSLLSAKHIIGGDFTYKCISSSNGARSYRFTLYVYRDCAGGGAEFDPQIRIGIWKGGGNDFVLDDDVMVNLTDSGSIPVADDPCVEEPQNLCVEFGLYEFTINNLKIIPQSYLFTYQRCCRNETITNIFTNEIGATFMLEMTAEAQNTCNESPKFTSYPPVLICANFPLSYDHSAKDPQGDSLVYSFCAPIVGGGTDGVDGTGDAFGCNGVMPTPSNSCPPPYDPVTFIAPLYSFDNPMGGSPQVQIDPVTGLITGQPTTIGQFVVGVCVDEYRNGVLLSRIRRDFQFNVTTCMSNVVAQVKAPKLPDGETFYVKICGDEPVTIKNTSFQTKFILTNEWNFDIGGSPVIQTSKDFLWNFPQLGKYQGTLIANKGLSCADTAKLEVEVFPGIEAKYNFDYDTCKAGPISFTDLSVADAGAVTDWQWTFGQEGGSTLQHPTFTFAESGYKPVELIIKDQNDCQDTLNVDIPYFPLPPILVVDTGKDLACAPASVQFKDLPPEVTKEFDIQWDFGDGGTGVGLDPTYIYEDTGTFSVFVAITSPLGCYLEKNFKDLVWVRPSPTAAFSYNPQKPSNITPLVNFTDLSVNNNTWDWDFNGQGSSTAQNPTYAFRDTGMKLVTLIVTHPQGCRDTVVARIDVEPQVRYFLPNAFTPNSDGTNDDFVGTGIFEGMQSFSMSIWNRWGDMVFKTGDVNTGWNGKRLNTGDDLPTGVYVYVVEFIGPRGDLVRKEGFATLVR